MRKTVQEWLDANNHSNGPAKKKVAGLKRLKRIPATPTTTIDALAIRKRRAKNTRAGEKRP